MRSGDYRRWKTARRCSAAISRSVRRGRAGVEAEPHPALEALRDLDPDALSPREALEKLYALRKLVE